MDSYVIYLLLGVIGGVLVGLIGGGIGPIVIPVLIYTLVHAGVNQDIAVHLAVGTSLCVVLMTTTVAICGYRIGKLINVPLLKRLLPGTVLGALFGSFGSALLSGKILQGILGVFLILLGLVIFRIKNQPLEKNTEHRLPSHLWLFIFTALLSGFSTILGISDGLLLIPFLRRFSFSMQSTIATSTVCAFFASLLGTIPYLLIGMHAIHLPEHTFGYVYLPAFFSITFASCLFSSVGVYLNKRLPEKKLKTIFAVFMIIVGAKTILI